MKLTSKEKKAIKLDRRARVEAAKENNEQPKQRVKKEKVKVQPTQFTDQQKKNYWMQRIVNKSNSSFKQFYKDMSMVVDWANHSGMDDKERSNLALMMADRFSAIIRRLAPQQAPEAESKDVSNTGEGNNEQPQPNAEEPKKS